MINDATFFNKAAIDNQEAQDRNNNLDFVPAGDNQDLFEDKIAEKIVADQVDEEMNPAKQIEKHIITIIEEPKVRVLIDNKVVDDKDINIDHIGCQSGTDQVILEQSAEQNKDQTVDSQNQDKQEDIKNSQNNESFLQGKSQPGSSENQVEEKKQHTSEETKETLDKIQKEAIISDGDLFKLGEKGNERIKINLLEEGKVQITFVSGILIGQTAAFDNKLYILIGREKESTFRFPDSHKNIMSGKHCKILYKTNKWMIEDCPRNQRSKSKHTYRCYNFSPESSGNENESNDTKDTAPVKTKRPRDVAKLFLTKIKQAKLLLENKLYLEKYPNQILTLSQKVNREEQYLIQLAQSEEQTDNKQISSRMACMEKMLKDFKKSIILPKEEDTNKEKKRNEKEQRKDEKQNKQDERNTDRLSEKESVGTETELTKNDDETKKEFEAQQLI